MHKIKFAFELSLIISIIFNFILAKEYTLKGYVYDAETGIAIPGVQIFNSDSSIGLTTDNNGFFRMKLPDKSNEINISHIKYYPLIREANFKASGELFTSYYLYSKTLKMDSVMVWGNQFFPGRTDKKLERQSSILWTRNYKQYRQMMKNGNWSWQELVTYGLWSTIKDNIFDKYWGLTSKSEREKFLDEFWRSNDPTPGTIKNEFRDEFERRIRYNWTHFAAVDTSGTIDNKKILSEKKLSGRLLKKLVEQEQVERLRSWSKRAPWDARGELYLKYGEPDEISISGDCEYKFIFYECLLPPKHQIYMHADYPQWYYSNLGIDFFVRKHYTSILSPAISPGSRTQQALNLTSIPSMNDEAFQIRKKTQARMENSDLSYAKLDDFYQNYIYAKLFMYDYSKQDTLSDFALKFEKSDTKHGLIFLNLDFVPEYFRSLKNDTYYSLISLDYKIIDNNTNRIVFENNLAKLKIPKKSDESNINISLPVNLSQGNFELRFTIEDHNANRKTKIEKEIIIDNTNL